MKVTIDINTPEEAKEISSFIQKKNSAPIADSKSERRQRLEKLFQKVRGHLPEGYTFDRNSIYDRQGLR